MSNPNYTDGDPNYTIPNPRLNPSNANILKTKGITDLFPFRIVTFSSMKAAGRIISRGYQSTDHQSALLFHHVITYASDTWLAVGDIVSSFNNNVQEYNVLLVYNNSEYCKIINNTDWRYVSRSESCNGTNICWSTRALAVENRNYNGYTVIGDLVITSGECNSWWHGSGGGWVDDNRVFAAVNPKYLTIDSNINRDSYIVANFQGDYSCRRHQRFSYTSPYGTFNITAHETTSGAWRDWNTSWPKYMFFDIKPISLLSLCCSDNAGNLDNVCGDYKSVSSTCENFMGNATNGYCRGDKLKEISCVEYCKKSDKCNTELRKYCNNDKTLFLNKNTEDICACFMTQVDYKNELIKQYQLLGPIGEELITKMDTLGGIANGSPECYYAPCKANSAIKAVKNVAQNCPTNQIQNCIAQSSLSNEGTLNSKNISTQQVNNCKQSSEVNSPSNNTTTNNTPSNNSSNNTPSNNPTDENIIMKYLNDPVYKYYIYGGAGFFIFFILLIIILSLGGDDDDDE